MLKNLKKAFKTPKKILIKKVIRKSINFVYHFFREFFIILNPISLKDKSFEHWHSNMKFFFSYSDKNYYIKQLTKLEDSKVIFQKANFVLAHIFDLLGSNPISLGDKIKWNQDFISGHIWKNKYYKKFKIIDLKNNGDPKVPWELSRFQHIPLLGQAYWISSDKKYINEFKNQIYNWKDANPIDMSINWTYSMDVAIRACNLITGLHYFRDEIEDKEFLKEINELLYLHGDFIYRNLEKGTINNNHYLSNLVGLIWLGLYFKNLKYSRNKSNIWLNYGISELEIEMENQIYSDGFDYEGSTSYHCLVLEMLLYTTILCEKNGITFSKSYNLKLDKMSSVLLNLIKPNGLIPIIGDMDNGRFIILTGYGSEEMRDFRYLLGVAGEYFDRDDYRYHALNQSVAFWMFPIKNILSSEIIPLKSISYPDGGIHILRSDKIYIAIKCGQNGTAGLGGHTHNDQLSFELNVSGEDIFVDPGTYVYTSNYKMRNLFRSTKYHNTLQIDNLEQNDFGSFNLFSINDETNARLLGFMPTYFEGEHYGFYKKAGLIHKRKIQLIDNNTFVIDDKISNCSASDITIRFFLAANINVVLKNGKIFLGGNENNLEIAFQKEIEIILDDALISYKYGSVTKTKVLVLKTKNVDHFKTKITII